MSRILVAALFVSAAAEAAQSVEVNNTAANPVPVTVTNPVQGSVQVTNTPSVTVTNPVQVSGSVEVTNTPAVTISGTPAVTVANQPGSGPLYSEPFGVTTGAGAGVSAQGSTVPAGRRRTLRTASATWSCPSGKGALVTININVPVGTPNNGGSVFGGLGSVSLPGQLVFSSALSQQDTYVATVPLNITMQSGAFVQLLATADPASNCSVSMWVFGDETAAP